MCISFSGCVFFFFKQKTAYEMRISDWSSDVCSSDLAECRAFAGFAFEADFATHQLGELARDRQTEAAAADLAAANLPERLEQPLALLGGDALRAVDLLADLLDRDRKSTRLNSSH